jgi:large subunit ribosomal protein L35
MPKMKTHSTSKKRFKKLASGKIKRSGAYRRHHAWAKSAKQGLQHRGVKLVHVADQKNVARLLAS